jgi:hypothetical protein
MLLGLGTEFEDHGPGRNARAASFGALGAEPDRSKGRFNGIGSAQMRPVLCREVIKGEQPFLVFSQALGRFWNNVLSLRQEPATAAVKEEIKR